MRARVAWNGMEIAGVSSGATQPIGCIPSSSAEVSGVFQRLAQPQHRRAVKLHEIWQQLKPEGGIPLRTDFSFERMGAARLLGHLFVIEPIDGGRDWRYRLLGSEITGFFNGDMTNVPFSRHFQPEEAAVCIALSNMVAETRTPVFLSGSIRSGRYSGPFETLSLPVWSRSRDTVWLIGGSFRN